MTVKIGFIGAGRMADAMIGGLIAKKVYTPDEIVACAPTSETRNRISAKFGIVTYATATELAKKADVLILAIKPKNIPSLFNEEKLVLGPNHLLVSIAAGIRISKLSEYAPESRIIRVMPNHCCMVLEGGAGYVKGTNATESDMALVSTILSATGLAVEVAEDDLDAVTGICGSSPAFAYMFIEALANAGMIHGLDRETAMTLAAQSCIGAGKMVLGSGRTAEMLIDGVCSPGGTTIEGVKVLKDGDLENLVIDAVNATVKRSQEMGKE